MEWIFWIMAGVFFLLGAATFIGSILDADYPLGFFGLAPIAFGFVILWCGADIKTEDAQQAKELKFIEAHVDAHKGDLLTYDRSDNEFIYTEEDGDACIVYYYEAPPDDKLTIQSDTCEDNK